MSDATAGGQRPGSGIATRKSFARETVTLAILLMLASGLLSSMVHVGVRFVAPRLPIIEVVFLRTLLTLIVTAPFVFRPGRMAWRTAAPGLQVLRGCIGVLSLSLWYYALAHMPLGDAATLGMTTTIFVLLGAAFWFRERVDPARWIAVAIGLAGAIVVLRPDAGIVSWTALIAVLSSVLWAVSLLLAKALARYDSSITIAFYQPLTIAPLAGIAALMSGWVSPSTFELAVLAGMALVAALGNYCIIHALRLADASITSPFDYMRLLWSVAWGYLLFSEFPQVSTWIGALLIVGASLFIAVRERQLARRANTA